MPKPFILRRRSGLYARFLVPVDIRNAIGCTYLVRPLRAHSDAARLVAAQMAVSLSEAFDAMRCGKMSSDELKAFTSGLTALQSGSVRDYKLRIGGIEIEANDEADHRRAMEMASLLARSNAAAVPSVPVAKSLSLTKAIADHIADLEREKLDGRTVDDSRHTLRLFAAIVGGDREVSAIDQDDIRAFLDGVRWWPSNASKREPYRGLPVREVIELAKANNEPPPKARTIQKHAQRLSVLFNALLRSKYVALNPIAGVRGIPQPDDEDGGRPFSPGELAIIFEATRFTSWAKKYPHRWFGVMLGLYSGARVNEIAQLQVADVEQQKGVWGFSVRRRAELRKKAKNKASLRFVPIARPVLDAGLLNYIDDAKKAGHTRLFPNLPNSTGLGFGRQLSRQFSTYIKAECGILDQGIGFHAFRHTIASELERNGASPHEIAAITGHKVKGDVAVLSDFYILKTLDDRVATLGKFRPLLELPKYTPGQFRRALRDAPIELAPMRQRADKVTSP
nr:site-specific integrase [Xanthomonas arboricola]MDN0205054.1 site-specific integrase [Xanthomonas arboricola pv. corylina]MDN0217999.1 site-specific integrase [Xanthomonas arboricola pv. corylina]